MDRELDPGNDAVVSGSQVDPGRTKTPQIDPARALPRGARRQWRLPESVKRFWPPKLRQEDSLPELVVPRDSKNFPQVVATMAFSWMCLNAGIGLSFVAPAIPSFLNQDSPVRVSSEDISWIASVDALGCILGGLLSGPLIATGRRNAYRVLLAPIALHWALMAFAANIWMIYASRFISGVSLAALFNAVSVYVSEISSQHIRGLLGSLPALFVSSGFVLCFIVGKYADWRSLALFGLASASPCFLLVFLIPETPPYLVSVGRMEEARRSLQLLRGKEADITLEMAQLGARAPQDPSALPSQEGAPSSTRGIAFWSRATLRPLSLVLFVCFLFRFCGIRSVQSYASSILDRIGTNMAPSTGVIVIGLVQAGGNVVAAVLMNRMGRRPLLLTSCFFMHLTLMVLGFLVKDTAAAASTFSRAGGGSGPAEWASLATLAVYIMAFAVGMSPLSGLLIGELLPLEHRSITASVCGVFSWFCAFVVTLTFPLMVDWQPLQLHGTLWFYSAISGLGFVVVYVFLPETNGKTLDQIQRKFRR